MKFRQDIQALRGIAVIGVLLSHAQDNYFPLGYLGVDIFFIISGFVVTPLIMRMFSDQIIDEVRRSEFREFFTRRFFRLAPALGATLMFTALVTFLFASIEDHRRIAEQGIFTILLSGNIGAPIFAGNYFTPNPNPLIHTWSLSVEEQIYIFIPLILALVLRYQRDILRSIRRIYIAVITVSLSLFLFPSLIKALSLLINLDSSFFNFYSTFSRAWEFALGGMCYLMSSKRIVLFKSNSFRGMLIAFLPLSIFSKLHFDHRFITVFICCTTFASIYFQAMNMIPQVIIRIFVWFGDRSYSIYLLHMPLLYIAKYSSVTQIGTRENRIIQTFVALLLTVALGSASYHLVENRYRYKATRNSINVPSIKRPFFQFVVLPMLLFCTMLISAANSYWGLGNLTVPAKPAWENDLACKRLATTSADRPCMYKSERASKTVLLIGDSYAAQFSQAVVDAAERSGWNSVIWTMSGCKFSLRTGSAVSADCVSKNLATINWILENQPNSVIISQNNFSYVSQADLKEAIQNIGKLVPSVLLIGNTPTWPDQRFFGERKPLIMRNYKPPRTMPVDQFNSSHMRISHELLRWANKNGYEAFDLNYLFCNSKICFREKNGQKLFYDGAHLSMDGANLSVGMLERYLDIH